MRRLSRRGRWFVAFCWSPSGWGRWARWFLPQINRAWWREHLGVAIEKEEADFGSGYGFVDCDLDCGLDYDFGLEFVRRQAWLRVTVTGPAGPLRSYGMDPDKCGHWAACSDCG